MFADDLTMFQEFDRRQPLDDVMCKLTECRANVHKWGRMNRVSFDAGKEHLVVIHPVENHGESFRLLGCMVDLNLRMHSQIEQLLAKIRPKSKAILRTRAYYNESALIGQYKTHIWGLVEVHSAAYFHADGFPLTKIDQKQDRFLEKLNVSVKLIFGVRFRTF